MLGGVAVGNGGNSSFTGLCVGVCRGLVRGVARGVVRGVVAGVSGTPFCLLIAISAYPMKPQQTTQNRPDTRVEEIG